MGGKIVNQFDIPEVLEVYTHHNNYEVLELNPNDRRCIIYFSSHDLYYPNQPHVFHRNIIEGNRFEWKNNVLRSAKRAIFVRDVTKQWYLDGINPRLNTIEKLASFLAEQTLGLEVICVGNSAGGYVATLIGSLLQASHVFNFSGQFSLHEMVQTAEDRALHPTVVKYENNPEYRKHYSIVGTLKAAATPVFYFFPAHAAWDSSQSQLVAGLQSVYPFRFDTEQHGSTCYYINYLDLFSKTREELCQLYSRYQNTEVSQFEFSVGTSGLAKTLAFKVKRGLRGFVNSFRLLSPSTNSFLTLVF